MRLWGRSNSFNVQKVQWLLAEIGIEAEHTQLGGRHGGLDETWFADMNLHRKVPVLKDGGLVLWESHTIVRYLAERYGGTVWWPAEVEQRALHNRWIDWQATRLQPDFMALFWGYYRQPETERNLQAVNAARQRCAEDFRQLDAVLAGQPYLSGDTIGLADIPAGATLFRYFGMGLDVPRPANVMAWYERLKGRPAYRRGIMQPFEELFGRSDY